MTKGHLELIDEPRFSPGFRFSKLDAAVLFFGSYTALDLYAVPQALGSGTDINVAAALALPIIAFFLFCNAFRVSRPLELAWAALYVALMVATIRYQLLDWWLSVTLSIVALATVIYAQTRKPSYHGVGWQRINPNLPSWWKANVANNQESPGRGGSA